MASRRLSTYRARRDFSHTAEPSGSGTVAASARALLPAIERLVGGLARGGANRLTIRAPAARRQPLRLERHPE
jgi:hypothetical protein